MGSAHGKAFLNHAAFFIGWMLSPFTFWNDTFVNIPIAYLCANLVAKHVQVSFLHLVLIFYWITNGLGLFIMFLSGKKVLEEQKGIVRGLIHLLATILVYSFILVVLSKIGILKPIR